MVKIALNKSTKRITSNLMLRYWRYRLVDRMGVTNIMMLWTRNLTLMKQHLQMPLMFSCKLENLQSMILPNPVCRIITKDDGKGSARCAQFPMATLMNNIARK